MPKQACGLPEHPFPCRSSIKRHYKLVQEQTTFPSDIFCDKLHRPCLFPRPGDALAGDARHGEASQKSLSAFHRPQYKFRVLLPLRLTEARKTPGVWRDFFVGSLLSVENPIISGPKQARNLAFVLSLSRCISQRKNLHFWGAKLLQIA